MILYTYFGTGSGACILDTVLLLRRDVLEGIQSYVLLVELDLAIVELWTVNVRDHHLDGNMPLDGRPVQCGVPLGSYYA